MKERKMREKQSPLTWKILHSIFRRRFM